MARDRRDDDRYYDDRDKPRDDRYRDDDGRYDDRRFGDDRDEDRRYEDDRPSSFGSEPPTNGAAMTALLLGILSFVGGLTAIPGLICGFVGLGKASRLGGTGKGMALAGTLLSVVGIGVLGLTIWLCVKYVFVPHDSARTRIDVSNNFREIGLGMHNHESVYGHFPGPFTQIGFVPPGPPLREGELSSKLSWRVAILPFIEQDNLYKQFLLDQPWDGVVNRPHASVRVRQYMDPDDASTPDTRYRVFYGPETAFPVPGRMTFGNISDGSSNTIFVVESGDRVTWSQFNEMKFDPKNPPDPSKLGRPVSKTFTALLGDGSVRSFRKTMSPKTLSAGITAHGGEAVNLDD